MKLEFHYSNEGLIIKLQLSLLYPLNKIISLEFYDIIDYSFYLNGELYFYNLESYKFFKDERGFYLSLDPFSEDETVSEEDNDFVLSKKVRLVDRTENSTENIGN